MRRTIVAGASLMVLAACSGSAEPVGENSAGSVKTTAVGNVVATIPSPTPTPVSATNAMAGSDSMTSPDAGAGNAM